MDTNSNQQAKSVRTEIPKLSRTSDRSTASLLVASMADIDEQAASDLQHARRYVLAALELIRPKLAVCVPVEELPVNEFAVLVARRQAKFDPLFRVLQPLPPKDALMPSKLNGRRNRRHYGCF
jgi:hypothetical protein